ncbi:transcriptional regulator, GntR family [Kribbella flavida DSM 17836]|uniref:Transcriptional regulator, GntR family n=1 Tax=Kribbella flavida (strain DSM 17836 / JCM 10339 / NBRC 14399) TaxID=479435 RepID=D2PQL6_KRIFD|nr:GntR family transcriptional regulator [Kribbella flavida]ADB29203.1 transcriptional regulator, GntR family [Kribbella flavida DSM 17836]
MRRKETRDRLLALIEDSGPGQVLPSERSLSETLGVSRPTLRAALDDLARDGLVVREHGRGTFISARKIHQELEPTEAGDFAVPPAEGSPWHSRLVSFGLEPAGARMGRRLEVSPGTELVSVVRLRLVDGLPMCIERILVPAAAVPGITGRDFELGSFYGLLRGRYGVAPKDAVQVTEPTVTDAQESALLDVPLHSPALLIERTTRTADRAVIEYTRSVYRGDRYRITTRLTFAD